MYTKSGNSQESMRRILNRKRTAWKEREKKEKTDGITTLERAASDPRCKMTRIE